MQYKREKHTYLLGDLTFTDYCVNTTVYVELKLSCSSNIYLAKEEAPKID